MIKTPATRGFLFMWSMIDNCNHYCSIFHQVIYGRLYCFLLSRNTHLYMTNAVPTRNINVSKPAWVLESILDCRKQIAWLGWACVLLTLTGCSSTQGRSPQAQEDIPLATLAVPQQVSYQSELALAKLGQMLSSPELNPDQRAELFYERGVMFDRVGLRTMARIDFSRALRERPDFAEAYNFIGVYLTQQQNFDEAYEAFDSALELAPEYDYAYLNRGIALYYGKRPALAVQDLGEFYRRRPEDPYRVLWLYMAERNINNDHALLDLQRRYKQHGGNEWGWNIVGVVAGEQSEAAFFRQVAQDSSNNKELAERLCEAYFYFGKVYLAQGQIKRAASYFKLSMASNIYDFIEYRYAMLELNLLDPALAQSDDEEAM